MKKMWMAIDNKKVIGIVEKEIFGSFVEHLGRSVYNGIYEPTHKTANAADIIFFIVIILL